MSSPNRRPPHAASALLLSLLLLGLTACGGGSKPEPEPPASEEPTSPPEATVAEPAGLPLRVLLRDDVGEKSQALLEFEREHGVELVFSTGAWDPDAAAEHSLVEIDYWALGDHLVSGHLEALPAGEDWLEVWWGGDAVRREGQVWGVPWRGRLHGLRLPDPVTGSGEGLASWATLGRLSQRLGGLALPGRAEDDLDPGPLVSVWLANGTSFWGGTDPGPDAEIQLSQLPAVEALEFLVRLHRDAPRGGREVLRAHVQGGGLAAGSQLGPHDDHWIPWPTPDGDHRVVWAEPRILARPRQGPHAALAEDFLRYLGAQSPGVAFAPLPESPVQSLHRGSRDLGDATVRALPAPADGERLRDILSESLGAALERRRSPGDALEQAQARWMTAPLHDRQPDRPRDR